MVDDFYFSFFLRIRSDFDLLRFKNDLIRCVSLYERSAVQAIKQVFDASTKSVRVEELYTKSNKADSNASNARCFSWYCLLQWDRFVTLSPGVRYFTISFRLFSPVGGNGISAGIRKSAE